MGYLPVSMRKEFLTDEGLQKTLDIYWNDYYNFVRAYRIKQMFQMLEEKLPNHAKNVTFEDVYEEFENSLHIETTIPTTCGFQRKTFSTFGTPKTTLWDAASASASPLCRVVNDVESFCCDGFYNYTLFPDAMFPQHATFFTVSFQEAFKDYSDLIYIPKTFKSIEEILKYLTETYQIDVHGRLHYKNCIE